MKRTGKVLARRGGGPKIKCVDIYQSYKETIKLLLIEKCAQFLNLSCIAGIVVEHRNRCRSMSGRTLSRGSHSRGQLHHACYSCCFFLFLLWGWVYLARVGLDLCEQVLGLDLLSTPELGGF